MSVRVKVLLGRHAGEDRDPFTRFPGYTFVYDPDCQDYDWLVVYDELPDDGVGSMRNGRVTVRCPRERTILCTSEPTSIKNYSRAYTLQFGHLLTNRPPEAENHPHHHFGRGYYEFLTGRSREGDYAAVIPPKTRTIATVCSSKQMRHTRHYARYRLTSAVAKAVPELDWYGYGVKPLGVKHEALDPCRYCLAIENHLAPGHWTEKLSDAFLCECLPFYAGDPTIADIFPADSFIPIPLDKPDEAVRMVKAAIAEGAYERHRDAVLEAKRLVLEKYNFWAQVIQVIESAGESDAAAVEPWWLWDRKALRRHSVSALLEDGWYHFKQYARLGL